MGPASYSGKALEIEGWMSAGELAWLFDEASRCDVVIEIGSWKGRSTKAIAEGCPGTLFFIDHIEGTPGEDYGEIWKTEVRNGVSETLLNNLKPHIDHGRAFFIEAKSSVAAAFLRPILAYRQPDMIFIDGNHTYDYVINDIRNWGKYLKKPALLCGHDSHKEGVKRAINELVPVWEYGPGAIWFKPDFVGDRL